MKTEKTIWQKSREELFQELSSTPEGLTGAEAARRLEHYGPNELQEGGRKSVLRIFLEQFADFLVIILILAAVVSAILGALHEFGPCPIHRKTFLKKILG